MSNLPDHKLDSDKDLDIEAGHAASPNPQSPQPAGGPLDRKANQDKSQQTENGLVDPTIILNLEQFRGLMGIPFETKDKKKKDSTSPADDPLTKPLYASAAAMNRPHTMPNFIHRMFGNGDNEAATSIYYTILRQEKANWRRFYIYDWVVYGALITQLVLSAALIILGAMQTTHHISISIIGAVQGVLAGVLSILKGQGLPSRLLRYAETMRKVRDEIDFHERELRMGLRIVTLGDALRIRDLYEQTRSDEVQNHPDVWQTGISPDSFAKNPQNVNWVTSSVGTAGGKSSGIGGSTTVPAGSVLPGTASGQTGSRRGV